MKKETQLRIFCLLLLLLGAAHYLYTSPEAPFLFLLAPPIILLGSLTPAKKIRPVDHSQTVSFIGILFFISSYLLYFLYFFENLESDMFIFVFTAAFLAYYIFLVWYKGLWTS